MKQKEFDKKLEKVINEMTIKHNITKHRLLNYGGMIGAEFQEKIKELKVLDDFNILFMNYERR